MTCGLILAGGESRRMGSPKALLEFQGETFLDRLIGLFSRRCSPVIAVLGAQHEIVRAGLRRVGEALLVQNPDFRLGQLTSMQCGLLAVPADADGVLFTLVDHPAVAPATIAALIDVPLAALLDLTSARPRCCASHDPATGAGSGHATRKGDRLHRRGRCRHPGGRGRPCGLRDAAGWERRMKRTVKRAAKWLSIAMAVLLMAGIAAPYLSGNRFAPCIRAALESALGRKVELGAIHFSLFAGPGFSVDNVVIHENPAIGIEPIAYVGSLEAVPRLTLIFGIFGGRLEFASIRLDDASINVAKTGGPSEPGRSNFKPLLNRSVIRRRYDHGRALPLTWNRTVCEAVSPDVKSLMTAWT